MKTKTILLFLVISLSALIIVQGAGAMTSDRYRLDWHTMVNNTGGGPAFSTHYQANLTIGQTPIQNSTSSNYQASMGYWAGVLQRWFQHLPLIVNVSP
jgi:hypothetical protein